MKFDLNIFKPNQNIPKATMSYVVAFQICLALLLWITIPMGVIPKPEEVITSFNQLWSEGLAVEIKTSLFLCIEAMIVTSIISLFISYITVVPFFRPIAEFISKGRYLGLVGLTFVFQMMTPNQNELKLVLLVFGMTVFFITSMTNVVATIPKERFDHARTLKMKEWQVVWEVVILGKIDMAIEVLRQNFAISWMMLTMVEGIARSDGGVGALLLNQNKHFHLGSVFAIIGCILILGLVIDYLLGVFKNLVCPYSKLSLERK